MMHAVAKFILRHVRYALAMPNNGPIRTIEEALEYHAMILGAGAFGLNRKVEVIVTLYFTGLLTPRVIQRIKEVEEQLGIRIEVKYYPPEPGATTGSGHGIPLDAGHETLLEMQMLGVPFLLHAESVYDRHGRELPDEERESHMIENVMWQFRDKYPRLRHSIEHASTKEAVRYVEGDPSGNTFMTVTPQHSLFIGDDFHELGTDLKCKPIVKSLEHVVVVVKFITSGDKRAGAGDDTAPHPHKKKLTAFEEAANGCWLPHALELYAEVFDRQKALDHRFERFMSLNAVEWRGLAPPDEDDTIRIIRKKGPIPAPVPIPGADDVIASLGWGPDGDKLTLSFAVA